MKFFYALAIALFLLMPMSFADSYAQYVETCEDPKLQKAFVPIDLNYDIDGGIVTHICKVEKANSVITVISAESDGQLTITIPKSLIHSLSSTDCSEDSDLMILMDSEEVLPVKSIHSKKDNTLTVEFTEGSHTIEFVGFSILPDPSPAQYCGIVMGFDSLYLPPKFQIEKGMKPEQVKCNEGLVPIIKATNDSPACVKPETKQKLIQREWSKNYEDKTTIGNNKIDCNYPENPYLEYECFKNAYSNCQIATVNPEIYTIEGDPVYTNLTITPDCKIQGVADMSTDRFWGTPEIITTKCDAINRDEYAWSVKNCDADNLPEMQFNFEMQLYPKILECEENGNIWNREKLECVMNEENEH